MAGGVRDPASRGSRASPEVNCSSRSGYSLGDRSVDTTMPLVPIITRSTDFSSPTDVTVLQVVQRAPCSRPRTGVAETADWSAAVICHDYPDCRHRVRRTRDAQRISFRQVEIASVPPTEIDLGDRPRCLGERAGGLRAAALPAQRGSRNVRDRGRKGPRPALVDAAVFHHAPPRIPQP